MSKSKPKTNTSDNKAAKLSESLSTRNTDATFPANTIVGIGNKNNHKQILFYHVS